MSTELAERFAVLEEKNKALEKKVQSAERGIVGLGVGLTLFVVAGAFLFVGLSRSQDTMLDMLQTQRGMISSLADQVLPQ